MVKKVRHLKCLVCGLTVVTNEYYNHPDICSSECYSKHLIRLCKECSKPVPTNVERSPFCSTQCLLDYFVYLCYEITGKTCI